MTGVDLAATDELPIADRSASETRRLTAKELVQNGLRWVDDGALPGVKIADNSLTAQQLAPNSVGASELTDSSVDTNALMDLAVTNSKIAAGVDGAKLLDGTVTAAKVPATSLDRGLDKVSGAIGHANAIGAGVRNGISYDAQGHITAAAALAPTDLPTATNALKGGVIVPAASGLNIGAAGELSHQSSIAAGTTSGITYNATGHITAVARLAPGDMPIATATTDGVVKIPGPGLSVDAAGALTHDVSPVAPGAYPKVTVDARGHVTAGQQLAGADIPAIDATKINTGVFDPARIAARSISKEKLDNYSVSYIQEASPSAAAADNYIGQLWYQESTAQLFMWNGNSWMQVGSLGRLGTENMRFSGTWDAATGHILVITNYGKSAGLTAAAALPAASDALTGVYLVTTTPGTHNSVPYDNGDWVLCLGATAGWVRVDTLSSAGSSTISLKDLLDVNIPTPGTGDALIFDGASNRWVNRPTSAVKTHLTPAFDGIRTSFQLANDADHVNEVLLSLGGVVQNPGVDFTLTGSRTIDFVAPPPTGLDYWVLLEGMPSTSVGGGGTTLPPGTAAEEILVWNNTLGSWQPATTLNGGTY